MNLQKYNPFVGTMSDTVRKWVYLIVSVLLLAISAWQASEGNWVVFAATFLASLQGLMAASNVDPPGTGK
jgi:hypothetical protein